MKEQMTFKRYEMKYMLNEVQYRALVRAMKAHMVPDAWGHSTIRSLYLDTPDWLLARRSLDKPEYKEKLRLRSYKQAEADTPIFAELKKKYEDIVYKRRIHMTEEEAVSFLCGGKGKEALGTERWEEYTATDRQIASEMAYAGQLYKNLRPAVLLTYERDAWYDPDDHDFRVTFDSNILWRDHEVDLHSPVGGEPLLEKGQILMEVKTAGAIPLWMVEILSRYGIRRVSFSKYGMAYQRIFARQMRQRRKEQFVFAPRRMPRVAAAAR